MKQHRLNRTKRGCQRVFTGTVAVIGLTFLLAVATEGHNSVGNSHSGGAYPFYFSLILGVPLIGVALFIWLIDELGNPSPPSPLSDALWNGIGSAATGIGNMIVKPDEEAPEEQTTASDATPNPAAAWRSAPYSFQYEAKQRAIWAMEAFEEKYGRPPTREEAAIFFTPPNDDDDKPKHRQRPSATYGL